MSNRVRSPLVAIVATWSASPTTAPSATALKARRLMPPWYPDTEHRNPMRAPDWRWQRALSLVAGGRSASRKRDDDETCRAVAFLRDQKSVVTEAASRGVFKRFPDIVLTLKLHQGNPIRRLEIECRVLARQPAALIAETMQVPAHLVRAYESLFFDVRGRIDAITYIIRDVVGVTGTCPAPAEAWAKWAAYHHGPAMIEPWLDYLKHHGEPNDFATLEGWRRDAIDIFVQSQNVIFDGRAGRQLLKCLSFVGDMPKIGEYRTAASVLREGMIRAVDQIPWAVGRPETQNNDPASYNRAHRANSCDDLEIRPSRERLRTA